jgi:hypothetical protein
MLFVRWKMKRLLLFLGFIVLRLQPMSLDAFPLLRIFDLFLNDAYLIKTRDNFSFPITYFKYCILLVFLGYLNDLHLTYSPNRETLL